VNAAASAYTDFDVATVPGSAAGTTWVGTPDVDPPLDPSIVSNVNVSFSLVTSSAVSVDLHLSTSGFPENARWVVQYGAQGYGYTNSTATQVLPAFTSFPFTPAAHSFPNGTQFVPTEVDILEIDSAPTWSNTTLGGAVPATVDTSDPSCIIIHYAMKFHVTVAGTTGGTVSPSTAWVDPGTAVSLHATPVTGYYFVNWSGLGPGAVNATTPDLTLTAIGPMWMLALFAPVYYTVTVTATGIPFNESFEVLFNSAFYASQNGTVTIPLVLAGYYSVQAPYAYSSLSPSMRYVAQHIDATVPSESNGTFHLTGNASFVFEFTPQYALIVNAVGPGTVTPYPGAYWITAGTTVGMVGLPDTGFALTSWAGVGLGAYSGSSRTFSLTMIGPVTETANFGSPLGPATFEVDLEVVGGLPNGTDWDAALGAIGGHTASGSLMLWGVPGGSFPLAIPAIYLSPWARLVANAPAGTTVSIARNTTVNVTFTEQFALSVDAGPGGVVASVPAWTAVGSPVSLSASASAGYAFSGWNGTWASTASPWAITVNSSLNETATFTPIPAPPAKVPPILVAGAVASVVLVVGVIVGYRFLRTGTLRGGPA
jgi:hypothetical protein